MPHIQLLLLSHNIIPLNQVLETQPHLLTVVLLHMQMILTKKILMLEKNTKPNLTVLQEVKTKVTNKDTLKKKTLIKPMELSLKDTAAMMNRMTTPKDTTNMTTREKKITMDNPKKTTITMMTTMNMTITVVMKTTTDIPIKEDTKKENSL